MRISPLQPHGPTYLNAWSLVGRTVWEELVGVALLEAGFEISKPHAISS